MFLPGVLKPADPALDALLDTWAMTSPCTIPTPTVLCNLGPALLLCFPCGDARWKQKAATPAPELPYEQAGVLLHTMFLTH